MVITGTTTSEVERDDKVIVDHTIRGKIKSFKICGVCGDQAKSLHFGGVSCDSCKAFFRRSVQSDAYMSFVCYQDRRCEINVNSRKSCQLCRFNKCLRIGMETKWVMNEEERQALFKQRKEKRETAVANKTVSPSLDDEDYEPCEDDVLLYMAESDKSAIEEIVRRYREGLRVIPYTVVTDPNQSLKPLEIIEMFVQLLKRIVYFNKKFDDFNELCPTDQTILLKSSVLEICLLRSALFFDAKTGRWPNREVCENHQDYPAIQFKDLKNMVSPYLSELHIKFMVSLKELKVDEAIVTILTLIVLYCPDRPGLQHDSLVDHLQEKYSALLEKYCHWKFGPKGSILYPKIITKLADLRQLNDFHTNHHMNIGNQEVTMIQTQLNQMNFEPRNVQIPSIFRQKTYNQLPKQISNGWAAAMMNKHGDHDWLHMIRTDHMKQALTPSHHSSIKQALKKSNKMREYLLSSAAMRDDKRLWAAQNQSTQVAGDNRLRTSGSHDNRRNKPTSTVTSFTTIPDYQYYHEYPALSSSAIDTARYLPYNQLHHMNVTACTFTGAEGPAPGVEAGMIEFANCGGNFRPVKEEIDYRWTSFQETPGF